MTASAEAQVGALLGDELAQLPAVGPSASRAAARGGALRRRRRCGGCASALPDGRSAGASPSLHARPASGARPRSRAIQILRRCSAPSSVNRKKRSSSVASSGVSARIADAGSRPAPATARPRRAPGPESARRARRAIACSMPGCARSDRERARVVGRAQPVARAALAAQVGEGALVDDAPASRRSRRGRTVPAPRAAGGWRAAP